MDRSRIHAENAIRSKNESLNYLRLSSKIDAVASRVEAAIRMNQVTNSMKSIVKGLDQSLKNMDLEKVSKVMDTFEKQFEDLDVRSEYIQNAVSSSTTTLTPADQVDTLIQQVADLNGLELAGKLGSVTPAQGTAVQEQDELTERLNRLKQKT